MVKSMFAGVSGLKSHQQKMDVIGNNIANVNTWGYKAYSFNFQDSIYSTSIRSSGGATTAGAYGGRNPSQVGYGSSMGSISFQYTTGAPSPTDNDLDCMIDGTGLFLVGSMNGTVTNIKSSGLYLSRVGIFGVDNNGYLVDDQKNYVYGYALQEGTGIPEVAPKAATGTGSFQFTPPAAPNADIDYEVTILGITVKTKSSDVEEQVDAWIREVTKDTVKNPDGTDKTPGGDLEGWTIKRNTDEQEIKATNTVNLTFTADLAEDGDNASVTFPTQVTGALPADWEAEDGVNYEPAIAAKFSDQLSPIRIPIDPKTGAQYSLQSYSISEDGVIVGVDKQNRPITMGQLAIIAVENPNGLEKTSGYYFSIGDNAGDVEAVKPNTGPAGFIRSKFLEMPNVDLANEFSSMITTLFQFHFAFQIVLRNGLLEHIVKIFKIFNLF